MWGEWTESSGFQGWRKENGVLVTKETMSTKVYNDPLATISNSS